MGTSFQAIRTDYLRVFAAAMACACALPAVAAIPDRFVDAEDGEFDLSDYLLLHRGALPVPILITEPAVGYGGGLALAYFSQSFAEQAEKARAAGEPVIPPDIAVGAAFKTENGTWGAGGGYLGFWDHDRWRYTGFAGHMDLQLDYFSVTGKPRAYQLEANGLLQQILRRIGTSDWFAGARYFYISSKASFAGGLPEDVPRPELDINIGKMSLVVDHDTRDNIFTPNRGTFVEAEAAFARGAFGSDSNFETFYIRGFHWYPVDEFVFGVRGDARLSSGSVPFFAQPYIVLRGVPAARFQDKNALMAETEVRWNVTPRWAAVGFAGVGKAYGRRQTWAQADTVPAGGVGFRYLVARKLGLYAGIDVARSSVDSAIYITAGSNWR